MLPKPILWGRVLDPSFLQMMVAAEMHVHADLACLCAQASESLDKLRANLREEHILKMDWTSTPIPPCGAPLQPACPHPDHAPAWSALLSYGNCLLLCDLIYCLMSASNLQQMSAAGFCNCWKNIGLHLLLSAGAGEGCLR